VGSLTLPASGLVYVDANAIIYSVEKLEPYFTLLQPMWLAAQAGAISLIGSELLVLETLVKPIQLGDLISEATYRSLLLASNELTLVPITRAILESAARLRASLKLKTPDAIHASTALHTGSAMVVTNDHDLRRVPGLSAAILSDIA
jgi:predicted nucleic acid-binding protein